jgi:transcriptional regulator with XRE-family HTH domain
MQWKDYLAELAAKGVTQSRIARELGCGQATISDLALGKTQQPRVSLGMALLRLGARHGIECPPDMRLSIPSPDPD